MTKLKLPPNCIDVTQEHIGKTIIIVGNPGEDWLVEAFYKDGDTEILVCTNPAKAALKNNDKK
jgi:hypothetical protein